MIFLPAVRIYGDAERTYAPQQPEEDVCPARGAPGARFRTPAGIPSTKNSLDENAI